jgi:hypothetical protein
MILDNPLDKESGPGDLEVGTNLQKEMFLIAPEEIPPEHEADRPTATLVVSIDSDEITEDSPR